ncbi:MAG: methyltransferase domain-containing protein [Planctomycetaceae bacterium]|nr:methyltransferase domain-containing protein [Planctomycetaceae bacterium]
MAHDDGELSALRREWNATAQYGRIRANWDPLDKRGLKNLFIEMLHREAIGAVARFDGNQAVLDLGCGTGVFEEYLGGKVRLAVGVDLSMAMLQQAVQARIPGVSFCLYDGTTLPFASQAFDIIIAKGLTYHLSDALLAALLRECQRALKPEGRLITIDNCSSNPRHQDGSIHKLLYRSSDALVKLFTANGLRVADRYPIRRGRSMLQYLIRYGFYGEKRIPELARRELETTKARGRFHSSYYVQCLHVCCPSGYVAGS